MVGITGKIAKLFITDSENTASLSAFIERTRVLVVDDNEDLAAATAGF